VMVDIELAQGGEIIDEGLGHRWVNPAGWPGMAGA